MNNTNPGDAQAFPVLEVRWVRAGSPEAAILVATRDIAVAREVDTGEAGHVAGGRVIGLLAPEEV